MIESVEIALLARLLKFGTCAESKRTDTLINRYKNAGWLLKGSKRSEWVLRKNAMEAVLSRLAVLLPTWQADFELLESQGRSSLNPGDLDALSALRRPAPRRELINRRNWYAISGAGPKNRQRRPSSDILTRDWVLRVRPNQGLKAVFDDGEIDLYKIAERWSECIYPERAWMNIRGFSGKLPNVIITCENLGAYIDLKCDITLAVVYSPGKDVGPAAHFLKMLPDSQWLHFGDVDPEGVNIALQLSKKTARPLSFWLPSFIDEYFDLCHRLGNQWERISADIPGLAEFRKRGIGLYQERLMLDERLDDELRKTCLP